MTKFEELEQEAADNKINIDYLDFKSDRIKGLYCDGSIALSTMLSTSAEKTCILAEELGHHYTAQGNIIDMNNSTNCKQEHKGRMWAYNNQIGLIGLIGAFENGCHNRYEIAKYLDVTEDFLTDALESYKRKYGICTSVDNYTIFFIPSLAIMESI